MFFEQFPNTTYSIQNDAIQTTIKDYFRYVDVIDKLAQDSFSYQKVDILDGERPDNLSLRLYGTTDYYWSFFITNDFLKDGLSAWPKGDSEIKNHIANQFKGLSAFRFPVIGPDTNGGRSALLGIPILNEKYLPYLRLCRAVADLDRPGGPYTAYAVAKIVDYDANNALVWIDTGEQLAFYSTTPQLTPPPLGTMVTAGATYDSLLQLTRNSELFANAANSSAFTIQFHADPNDAAQVALRESYIAELRKAAVRFRPNDNYGTSSSSAELAGDANILDQQYNLTTTQSWEDGSLAPAHYYDPTDITEEISQYDAGNTSTFYVSNRDDIIEQNDSRKEIKVVSPSRIESFAQEFKRLLNE